MEDDQKKWKTNRSTKINLIGCDTIVNSPSFILIMCEPKYAKNYLHNNGKNVVKNQSYAVEGRKGDRILNAGIRLVRKD